MTDWSRWIGLTLAVGIIAVLLPGLSESSAGESLAKQERRQKPAEAAAARSREASDDSLAGLDLKKARLEGAHFVAPLPGGRLAELTLVPALQEAALGPMREFRPPEAGVVALDVATGAVLAYASSVGEGPAFDVNARAEAPAASVFKLVTAAALVEDARLSPSTRQCYHGGMSRIREQELRDDPRRDTLCADIGEALGKSLNVVFARLAQKHLSPATLRDMGKSFGFGQSVPFALANQAPSLDVPEEPVEFARTAAGFWHSSLSPLAAATMVQAIANDGVALTPRVVREIRRGGDVVWRSDAPPSELRRVVESTTARQLTRMMVETVAEGTARKSFRDRRGREYLPGIEVAGKTGSLTRHEANRLYSWFVGFAPADRPEIAVASLVVNTPRWHIKAPELARRVLQAHFARGKEASVSAADDAHAGAGAEDDDEAQGAAATRSSGAAPRAARAAKAEKTSRQTKPASKAKPATKKTKAASKAKPATKTKAASKAKPAPSDR